MSKKKPTRKSVSKGMEIAEQKIEMVRKAKERASNQIRTVNLAFSGLSDHHRRCLDQVKSIYAALPVSQVVQQQLTAIEAHKQTTKFMIGISEEMKSALSKPILASAIAQHSLTILEDQRKSIAQILTGFEVNRELFASTIMQVERSFAAEVQSLNKIFTKIERDTLFTNNKAFASRILASFEPYMIGIKQTTAEAILSVQSELQNTAARSLSLLTQQSIDTAERFAVLNIDYSMVQALPATPILNLPNVQHQELMALLADEKLNDVASTELSKLAREILTLLLKCNDVTDSSGRPRIFHITQRIAVVINELPQIIVLDRRSLGDFIDELYIALYEGAGTDNLRYLKKFDGMLDEDECGVIWRIKHFRNLWLRHNIERGTESDIRKRKKQLSDDLSFYELTHLPVRSHEFRNLQLAILKDVNAMLQALLDRLTA